MNNVLARPLATSKIKREAGSRWRRASRIASLFRATAGANKASPGEMLGSNTGRPIPAWADLTRSLNIMRLKRS